MALRPLARGEDAPPSRANDTVRFCLRRCALEVSSAASAPFSADDVPKKRDCAEAATVGAPRLRPENVLGERGEKRDSLL